MIEFSDFCINKLVKTLLLNHFSVSGTNFNRENIYSVRQGELISVFASRILVVKLSKYSVLGTYSGIKP